MIVWRARSPLDGTAAAAAVPPSEWPSVGAAPWVPRALHGDTNTDEMFIYTTILYLTQACACTCTHPCMHMHMLHMHVHTCTCHVCAHTSCLHPPARPHAHTRRPCEVCTRGVYGCSPLLLRPTQHGIDGVGGETGIADAVGPGGRVDAGLRVQPAVGRLLVFSSGSTDRYRGSWTDG